MNIPQSERVVALNSLSADIVFRLDQSKLVGRPGTRLLDQDEKINQITAVSQGQMPPDIEKITTLKPDLVIGSTGFHSGIAQKLEQQGIHTFLTNTNSWLDIEDLTKTLAASLKAEANPLLQKYQSILGSKIINTSTTLVLVARDPVLAPNKESWAGDMLFQLGINSLSYELLNLSPRKGFNTLSFQEIKDLDPEILFVINTDVDLLLKYYESQPQWSSMSAVKNNKVCVCDYYGLVIPGSIAAIEEAVNQLKLNYSG